MRAVLAKTRLHLHVCRIRSCFPFRERERAELLAAHQFRKPFLFLFVCAKQQQRPDSDRGMLVTKNGYRRATTPDYFEDFAVGHLAEPVSAVFLRRSHSEHADSP